MQRMSALQPGKKTKKERRKGTLKEKEIHVNKWQLSDSDSTITDPEEVTNK